ncbi:16S rRNA (uracil(1498)-N(3))-methyltransferase [Paracoccus suum]|uniref:Ribosomal RNA small subunit methyltransferase E n=1 Tax=Paracoccus suum TaxID=2259340 RepID=A0A344PIE2_9RHOB|nr:16S rRNA (uracil(1498)-N(3))-methyltransferase [Paracoccus suum]AXC49147.1 16S rRNA (uracil(1498)-N(3))-methyltransferase [Paracoccus suum]
MGTVRLYIDQPLCAGQAAALDGAQAHYLGNVMRLAPGAEIEVFNGRDGVWSAQIAALSKRAGGSVMPMAQAGPQRMPPDLWLAFAPLKKARTDFIVEKATELGCARILPVTTDYTNAERIARERLQAHAVEAAEQCGGSYVPEVAALQPLDRLLANLGDRRVMWADEQRAGEALGLPAQGDSHPEGAPWVILIGPEGGFSDAERQRIAACRSVTTVSLGPRILRADTAAVAAITLWQATLGDWMPGPCPAI